MRQAKPNTKSILQIAKRQTVETETLHSTCALEDWATILLVWFCMFYDVVSNAIQSGSKQWVIRWSSVRNQTSNLLTNFGFNKSTTLKVWIGYGNIEPVKVNNEVTIQWCDTNCEKTSLYTYQASEKRLRTPTCLSRKSDFLSPVPNPMPYTYGFGMILTTHCQQMLVTWSNYLWICHNYCDIT